MPDKPQALRKILLAAASGETVLHALAAQLPASGEAPEWITLFPKVGKVETRDGRTFQVDAATLIAAFEKDKLQLPVDVNHATDLAGLLGGRSDAVGWVTELKVEGAALLGKVDWLAEGRELLAAKKYRYVSPSFFAESGTGKATWLKAASLVTSPALGNQPALAAARDTKKPPEPSMKTIAVALGLTEDANEATCLASLTTRLQNTVAKDVHEATLAQLTATSAELATLKATGREKRVTTLIEGAVKAKKILPAEKEHFTALCATEAGIETVEKLFAAKTPMLTGSDLDERQAGDGEGETDPVKLAAAATVYQKKMADAGVALAFAEAVMAVKEGKK